MERFGEIAALVGSFLGVLFVLAQLSMATGVVREHCLNVTASQATQNVVVDSHWTYVLWPPLYLSALDPDGRCVRNQPLREALSAVGIWKLPSAEEQVRKHAVEQIKNQRSQP